MDYKYYKRLVRFHSISLLSIFVCVPYIVFRILYNIPAPPATTSPNRTMPPINTFWEISNPPLLFSDPTLSSDRTSSLELSRESGNAGLANSVGPLLGKSDGEADGDDEGYTLGTFDGVSLGIVLGNMEGLSLGIILGASLGILLGEEEGDTDGLLDG